MLYGRILRSPLPHAQVALVDLSPQPGAIRRSRGSVRLGGPGRSGERRRALCRRAGRRRRRDFDGGGARGAARSSASTTSRCLSSSTWTRRQSAGRADRLRRSAARRPTAIPRAGRRRRACRSTATCAGRRVASRGDAAQGLADAEVVVEGEYRTQVQTHCCLEPHGIVADWRATALTVYISTQFTAGVRASWRRRSTCRSTRCAWSSTAWAAASARSRRSAITAASRVALSRQAGAPVRLTLTATKSKWTPATARRRGSACASAPSRDGSADGDFARELRHGRRRRSAPASAISPRRSTTARISTSAQYDVFINAGPGSAMRAPGNTPGAFGPGAGDRRARRKARRSIRWRCAIASIRARCGARSGASAPSGSAGSAATRRAPTPGRSSAASASRNRCGAPMCRRVRLARCG